MDKVYGFGVGGAERVQRHKVFKDTAGLQIQRCMDSLPELHAYQLPMDWDLHLTQNCELLHASEDAWIIFFNYKLR